MSFWETDVPVGLELSKKIGVPEALSSSLVMQTHCVGSIPTSSPMGLEGKGNWHKHELPAAFCAVSDPASVSSVSIHETVAG